MKNKTKKIAIVTYNRVGEGQYDNGLIKRDGKEIYIAQNGHRSAWAADSGPGYERNKIRRRTVKDVIQQITLEDMNHIYLYVGAGGGEEAIRQTKDIPSEKITYVMCGCNYSFKRNLIEEIGNSNAETISCECGGRNTLERILKQQLAGGK
jgi:hypothetical protein